MDHSQSLFHCTSNILCGLHHRMESSCLCSLSSLWMLQQWHLACQQEEHLHPQSSQCRHLPICLVKMSAICSLAIVESLCWSTQLLSAQMSSLLSQANTRCHSLCLAREAMLCTAHLVDSQGSLYIVLANHHALLRLDNVDELDLSISFRTPLPYKE